MTKGNDQSKAYLCQWGTSRHNYSDWYPDVPAMPCQAQSVIASRSSHHPALALLRTQQEEGVPCPSLLETAQEMDDDGSKLKREKDCPKALKL
jgi:hypothetical protein